MSTAINGEWLAAGDACCVCALLCRCVRRDLFCFVFALLGCALCRRRRLRLCLLLGRCSLVLLGRLLFLLLAQLAPLLGTQPLLLREAGDKGVRG